jgi:hypothetical protein
MSTRAEQIIAALTPATLRDVVLELAKTQPPDDPGIMVHRIIEVLAQGEPLATGTEEWQATLQLQSAIRETVLQIPGMRYIEADS